ncbi:MAG: glycosyltransferase family 9 protein [Deltaproteobacteria bacterium]|nr:glycosyltransferase family 9 protein [Deltaproteobacteria bacterium]
MRILLVKLSALGDVIHTMPLAASLRRKFPQAEISWLIEEDAQEVLVGYDKIDRVIVSPRKSALREIRAGKILTGIKRLANFIKELRQENEYDVIIDAHGLFKSAVLVGFLRGKRKIGFASLQEGSGFFYREKIFEDMDKHAVDRYLDFAVYLGADTSNPQFDINADVADAEKLLSNVGIAREEGFIAISPNALWETKLWDDEKFAELADMIFTRLGMKVVLTGKTAGETAGVAKFARHHLVDLGGRTKLRSLAGVFMRSRVLVSTDSGPMHLAIAVGCPVVAIFGPTNAIRTGPYGNRGIVVSQDVDCRPCLQKKCSDIACMRKISAEDVFSGVLAALNNK